MDDIGTIIYILFLLISLLGGLWSNVQKKKREARESHPQQQPQPQPQHRETAMTPDQLRTLARKQQVQKEQAAMRLQQMEREAAMAREGSARNELRKKKKRREERDHEQEPEETLTQIDLAEFDARKAIIYSEILNPPYL